jgi:hypothetical protein
VSGILDEAPSAGPSSYDNVFVTRIFLVFWFAGCSASIPARPSPDGAADLRPSLDASPVADLAPAADLAPTADRAPADAAAVLVCEEAPARRQPDGATLELTIQVRLAGKALVFGEPNAAPGGGTLTPLNLRFYLSHLALLTAAGPVTTDLVDGAGRPLPYGVHLFNAEEGATARLRLVAPAGSYTGLGFTFGLDEACNATDPHGNLPPLTDSSQMTWPHAAGYLFLRYEAQLARTVAPVVDKVHMGGLGNLAPAPAVRLDGAITLPGAARTLEVNLDELFRGASMKSDAPSTIPLPEVEAGDRLRSNLGAVQLFRLAP